MSELVEYRMHQQIAQEIYRQQMLRLPGNFSIADFLMESQLIAIGV